MTAAEQTAGAQPERARRARAFGAVADAYEAARPEYPAEAVEWLLATSPVDGPLDVVDLGAGTGKLTRAVVAAGHRVRAVEPDSAMLARLEEAVPDAEVVEASAERVPLPDASADAVLVGQAFHWFDAAPALAEAARVLRPGGVLGLVWNTADPAAAWTRTVPIATMGRSTSEDQLQAVLAASGRFAPAESRTVAHSQLLDRMGFLALSASQSEVAVAGELERARVMAKVEGVYGRVAGPRGVVVPWLAQCHRSRLL